MTAADFRREHGDPLGDRDHDTWTEGDWDVWDHLHSADADPNRDRSDEARYARIAAERHKSTTTATGVSR